MRLEDGKVVSDGWRPAEIQEFGGLIPLHGEARAEALARWRARRGCAGLAARPGGKPAPASPSMDGLPAYTSSVRRIGPALQAPMSSTHGPRCPVPWSDLRYLRLSYVGFDGDQHTGSLVVAARRARDVVGVFETLHDAR